MDNFEKEFEEELEIFRREVDAGTQFFYTYLAIYPTLLNGKKSLEFANVAPLFWRTIIGALQSSFIITLGRIFDTDSRVHSVYRLLSLAQKNVQIFSKDSLMNRKDAGSSNANEWIVDYMKDVYVPDTRDFKRLRINVNKYRKKFEQIKYIRNKVFAHNEILSPLDVRKVGEGMNMQELQKVWVFLRKLHIAIWELYNNGRKPVLKPMRYSAERMRKRPTPTDYGRTLQERMVTDIKRYFDKIIHSYLKEYAPNN